MGCKLSHLLLDAGWFCALGSPEYHPQLPLRALVKCRTPFTYDKNNGVNVIYDEAGRPWITNSEEAIRAFNQAITEGRLESELHLTRGAYVPHSNGGEYFMRVALPELMKNPA